MHGTKPLRINLLSPRRSQWCLSLDRKKKILVWDMTLSIAKGKGMWTLDWKDQIKKNTAAETWRKTCWAYDIIHHLLSPWKAQVSQLKCIQRIIWPILLTKQNKNRLVNKLWQNTNICPYATQVAVQVSSSVEILETRWDWFIIYLSLKLTEGIFQFIWKCTADGDGREDDGGISLYTER